MKATKRRNDEATEGTARRRRRAQLLPSSPPSLRRFVASSLSRSAFTLTEILIVIALIVLIIALAVPAFSYITGSRSVDAGENLVSAMLSRARGIAVNSNQTVGVAFFRDTVRDRTAMAIVVAAAQREGLSDEAAGLEQYKAWRATDDKGNPVTYQQGDVVCALVQATDGGFTKMVTRLFVSRQKDNTGNRPPNAAWWGTLNESEFDTLVGVDHQYLPAGVGAQTINDPDPAPGTTGTAAPPQRDRYLRSGLVLFDGSGQLIQRRYTVAPPATTDTDQTHLYRLYGFEGRTGLANNVPGGYAIGVTVPIASQLGVVLYDEELFRAAGGSQEDPAADGVAYNATAPVAYNEDAEERWLDQNALNLMINRYNGTLVRGE